MDGGFLDFPYCFKSCSFRGVGVVGKLTAIYREDREKRFYKLYLVRTNGHNQGRGRGFVEQEKEMGGRERRGGGCGRGYTQVMVGSLWGSTKSG